MTSTAVQPEERIQFVKKDERFGLWRMAAILFAGRELAMKVDGVNRKDARPYMELAVAEAAMLAELVDEHLLSDPKIAREIAAYEKYEGERK